MLQKLIIRLTAAWKRCGVLEKLIIVLTLAAIVLWPLARGMPTPPSPDYTNSPQGLTTNQRKELTTFLVRAFGVRLGPGDVKNVPSRSDLDTMISAGLNVNGHLCASVKEIWPLSLQGMYQVKCVAYRGGSGTKTYIVDALKGIAFEQ